MWAPVTPVVKIQTQLEPPFLPLDHISLQAHVLLTAVSPPKGRVFIADPPKQLVADRGQHSPRARALGVPRALLCLTRSRLLRGPWPPEFRSKLLFSADGRL